MNFAKIVLSYLFFTIHLHKLRRTDPALFYFIYKMLGTIYSHKGLFLASLLPLFPFLFSPMSFSLFYLLFLQENASSQTCPELSLPSFSSPDTRSGPVDITIKRDLNRNND